MLFTLIRDIINNGFGDPGVRSVLMQLLLSLPVFLLSLSVHEAAHGYMAYRCGDPTAYMLGRVTLNPAKHFDPVGFLLLMTVGFGWAKPVPVNPRNYRSYRRDDLKVSMAGICANLLLVVAASIVQFLIYWIMLARGGFGGQWMFYLTTMVGMFITTNIMLAFFNLLPIPPLDGYHLLNDLVMKRPLFAPQVAQRVGWIAVIVLIYSGLVGRYLNFVHSTVTGGIENVMISALRALGLL